MSDGDNDKVPDYSKFNEDSVPPPEKEKKASHPGRPNLDYDDATVGPAEGVDYIPDVDKADEK